MDFQVYIIGDDAISDYKIWEIYFRVSINFLVLLEFSGRKENHLNHTIVIMIRKTIFI